MINRFIDVDGIPTRCIVASKEGAPALLLLHTTFLTAEMWMRNIDELGRDFFVVATDVLGHGFTRPPPHMEKLDIGLKVDHLIKLADTLKWREFAVGGASLGGLFAARVFLASQGRVKKLVINGSGSCFNTEDQLVASGQKLYERLKDDLISRSPEAWREVLKHSFHDARAMPEELLTIMPLCYAQPWMTKYFYQTLDGFRNRDKIRPYRILERLEEITTDTLVVWDRNDPGAVHESAIAGVQRMPKARFVSFENCAHMPMLEHPEKYNETLRTFLRE